MSANSPHSNEILQGNPLVKQKILINKFKFTLYLSVHDIGDIH